MLQPLRQPTRSSRCRARASAPLSLCSEASNSDVFQSGTLRQKMMLLKHESYTAIPERGQFVSRQRERVAAIDAHSATAGRLQRPQ